MREAVAPVPRPTLRPTLETVRKRFQTWRKKGPAGRRVPSPLWGAAVELCRDHSVSKVSRALRLDYYGLRNRVHSAKLGGGSLPFHRLENLQDSLGVPLPASTQWEIVERTADQIHPVYREMIRQAAQGEIFQNDDTSMKMLANLKNDDLVKSLLGRLPGEKRPDPFKDPPFRYLLRNKKFIEAAKAFR